MPDPDDRELLEADDPEDTIPLGLGENPDQFEDEEDLGPDERDMDLMDGSWEQQYYAGQARTRDWNTITIAIGLLVLAGLIVPGILVVFR